MKFPVLATILLSSVALSACAVTQPPAQVVMKGNNYYGSKGGAPIQIADATPKYQSRSVSATPSSKPVAAAPVVQVASAQAPRPSYGFQPSPSTVGVRERAELSQVTIKELEPLTAARAPAPEPAMRAVATNGIDEKAAAELAEQVAMENSAPEVLPEPQARVMAESKIPAPVSAPAAMSSNGFIWPVKGKVISNFGPRAGGEYNDGINIAAHQGEPIVAASDGEVVYSGNELRGYGNMVILRHDNGLMTAYAHADRILVSKGETVRQGGTIATVGKSGGVDQAQVHFGVRKDKEPVDPMNFLNQSNFASR